MNRVFPFIRRTGLSIRSRAAMFWSWYRGRKRWQQALMALAAVGAIGGIIHLSSGHSTADASQLRTVTVESVSSLEGGVSGGTSIVGKVRSVTGADLLAQAGGTVESIHTKLGAQVPAGFVIADLDNASQAAAVLQAQGAYDAAVAARNITVLQSGSAQTSFGEAQNSARATYQTAYTTIDTALTTQVDQLFGGMTPLGPQLLISSAGYADTFARRRQAITDRMSAWQAALASANTSDPAVLLNQAYTDTQAISSFLVDLAAAARDRQSGVTTAQLTALSTARATVNGELSAISAARDAYNSKKTAAAAAGNTSSQGTQLAAADANVESALGALRAAQAAYEKTRIRATIGGTVNYLPIQRGQYVSAFQHVATVANNGALEIVAYVPQDQRNDVAVGMKVSVEGGHDGTVTSVAPALDPTTQQIEVHVAVNATPDLVNGQSVRITLPSAASGSSPAPAASSTPSVSSQDLLPLTAVKLLPDSRAVFTVDQSGRVVAHTVTVGDVVGDRILVTSGLTPDLVIITDVRGLSEGQKVQIGSGS